MLLGLGWELHGDGSTPPPGEVVRPDERLSWVRTAGIGAQHVVAMFGATFVFPIIMGLDPNLAIMMSGIATVVFLLVVQGRVPSYLGTSAAFVGAVVAIRAVPGNDTSTVTGAVLVAGAVLLCAGVVVHLLGGAVVDRVLPPVVTGAVVPLIGLNLAPVVADVYWPQDQWVALATMAFVLLATVVLRGFWARISILLGLVLGFLLSWLLDATTGPITSVLPGQNDDLPFAHDRVSLDAVSSASWVGLPDLTAPSFELSAVLLVLPAVIALLAENAGHVKAVAAMTGDDLDPFLGRAFIGDGLGTMIASSVGGAPTTTYAENIGVMAATRVYSTAAYYVAAGVAVAFGLCPKFGALVAAVPGGVLGGITVVLYGMIGLLGAKIWIEHRVDFSNPVNMVSVAAGVVIAVGNTTLVVTDQFQLQGIALGTIVVLVSYHLLRAVAPAHLRDVPAGQVDLRDEVSFGEIGFDRPGGAAEHEPDGARPPEHPTGR